MHHVKFLSINLTWTVWLFQLEDVKLMISSVLMVNAYLQAFFAMAARTAMTDLMKLSVVTNLFVNKML